jgi:ribosomal protein L18
LRSKHVVTTFLDVLARFFNRRRFLYHSKAVEFASGVSDGGKVVEDVLK